MTPEVIEVSPVERKVSGLPLPEPADTPATSTPLVGDCQPRETSSPIPTGSETPRKRTLPARPAVPPKPDFSREVRATSEPPAVPPGVLSGGEPISLPPSVAQQATDSPMPELLSLKDRLKLFEKEIEDQHKEPEPKKDRKFSFLSEDEVSKMKEEEAKRIASMTAMSMEAFESLTSQVSQDEQILSQHIEDLEKYDTSTPADMETAPVTDPPTEVVTETVAEVVTENSAEVVTENMTEAEKRAAWRKARLQSLEDDALQAQLVIEKMSELTSTDSQDNNSKSGLDCWDFH